MRTTKVECRIGHLLGFHSRENRPPLSCSCVKARNINLQTAASAKARTFYLEDHLKRWHDLFANETRHEPSEEKLQTLLEVARQRDCFKGCMNFVFPTDCCLGDGVWVFRYSELSGTSVLSEPVVVQFGSSWNCLGL